MAMAIRCSVNLHIYPLSPSPTSSNPQPPGWPQRLSNSEENTWIVGVVTPDLAQRHKFSRWRSSHVGVCRVFICLTRQKDRTNCSESSSIERTGFRLMKHACCWPVVWPDAHQHWHTGLIFFELMLEAPNHATY